VRIAIVSGIAVAHDAISAAVARQAEILQRIPTVESVTVFAQHVSRDLPCPSYETPDPWALVRHPAFERCDLAIFHWGIHYSMFDALTLLADAGPTRPVVHFHNCTPRHLVVESEREVIDRSVRQVEHAISLGVPFWTYSEFNRRTLVDWGAAEDRIAFVPIPLEIPPYSPSVRRSKLVQLLAVGRRVPAKGLHVLIEALGLVNRETRKAVRLRIAGSSSFSDASYMSLLDDLVSRHHLVSTVTFVDEPTDVELWKLYCASDVVISPSFHEGLCVPIIEGYAVGCRAIGTTAGNLPFVVQPPDRCVEPGDPQALAVVIEELVGEVKNNTMRQRLHSEFVEQYSIAACRSTLQHEIYRLAASVR
jgi:glycosyltransferase involved in cell wall biosynthesis